MIKKLSQIKLSGWLMLVLGLALLFIGTVGALDLFAPEEEPLDYSGVEVPRDLIEEGYSQDGEQPPESENEDDFVPFFVPLEKSSLMNNIPTLEAADSSALTNPDEILTEPTFSPDELEILQEAVLEETAAVEENDEEEESHEESENRNTPLWIYISSLDVRAPIIPAEVIKVVMQDGDVLQQFEQWEAPDEYAAGWHTDSAALGEIGNTVLNGHHNSFGKVFRNLAYLQEGDLIQVFGGDQWFNYVVSNKMVLPEWNVSIETRMANAAWIMPSEDERLTLVTCWPEQTNSHRLIIVARPVIFE